MFWAHILLPTLHEIEDKLKKPLAVLCGKIKVCMFHLNAMGNRE